MVNHLCVYKEIIVVLFYFYPIAHVYISIFESSAITASTSVSKNWCEYCSKNASAQVCAIVEN